MPRQTASLRTERLAVEIVRAEEEARGRVVQSLSKSQERVLGCDLLSRAADGPEDFVEVKGWGEPLLVNGAFSYPADVNREQYERACTAGERFRLELVGNLTAEQSGAGEHERLTLTGEEVRALAEPWRYRLVLDGLEGRVRQGPATSTETMAS